MLGGTKKERAYIKDGETLSYEAGEATFAVEEIFKGVQGEEVKTFISTHEGTSCQWSGLLRGGRYVVYAGGEPNRLSVAYCGSTKRIENAKDDLDFLRSLPAEGTGQIGR